MSVFLTVSWETLSTTPSSAALSASKRRLHRSFPLGGSEQARAISLASACPSRERS